MDGLAWITSLFGLILSLSTEYITAQYSESKRDYIPNPNIH